MATQTISTESNSVTEWAVVARSLLTSDDIELPVLPEVSLQLLELTSDVNCEPKDIIELLRRDQSLTGNLLKTANSVRYTCGQPVTSIQQAVARLGLLCIREVVMVISCQTKVFDVARFESDVRQSFDRSLATAAFSQEIARSRRLNVEDAFLCGLLHDIGRPVVLQALSDHRTNSGDDGDEDALRLTADDVRIPMASRLVLSWDLPQRLADIIEHQQTPVEAGEYEQQAAILNLAADLARMLLETNQPVPEDFDHPMFSLLNMYPADMVGVLGKQEEILEWVRSTV